MMLISLKVRSRPDYTRHPLVYRSKRQLPNNSSTRIKGTLDTTSKRSIMLASVAHVAELVDAHGSGPCAARCGGSSPSVGTKAFEGQLIRQRAFLHGEHENECHLTLPLHQISFTRGRLMTN